jgi:hypothetical protein
MLSSDRALSASVLMIFENVGLRFVIHEEVCRVGNPLHWYRSDTVCEIG